MNTLYYGDNLEILRDRDKFPNQSIDLIYLDPPFNSSASYNVLFRSPSGEQSHAQIEAFQDTWHWTKEAEQAFDEVMQGGNADASELLRAMRLFLKENDVMAYLAMMAIRLLELRRVLKETGSIYLHCDPTASHYLKLLMDSVYGPQQFRSEIIWKRTSSHGGAKRYGPVHDVILYYAGPGATWNVQRQPYDAGYVSKKFGKVDAKTGEQFQDHDLTGRGTRTGPSGQAWRGFNPTDNGRHWQPASYLYTKYKELTGDDLSTYPFLERLDKLDEAGLIYWPKKELGFPRYKQFLGGAPGVPLQDVWTDIDVINSMAQERLGYQTQKPTALLERIVSSSSKEGELVLDPFCGCGTTINAAQKLRREWIGIDITNLAISLIEKRLNDAFPGIRYEVHGTPKDLEGARALAALDKYEFQYWAVSLVNAVPYGGKKKGADTGIDGFIYFKPDARTTEKAIVSVKGGDNVNVAMLRDLGYVVKREKAQMGIFITLAEPTKPMLT